MSERQKKPISKEKLEYMQEMDHLRFQRYCDNANAKLGRIAFYVRKNEQNGRWGIMCHACEDNVKVPNCKSTHDEYQFIEAHPKSEAIFQSHFNSSKTSNCSAHENCMKIFIQNQPCTSTTADSDVSSKFSSNHPSTPVVSSTTSPISSSEPPFTSNPSSSSVTS